MMHGGIRFFIRNARQVSGYTEHVKLFLDSIPAEFDDEQGVVVSMVTFEQHAPNPFNISTVIEFHLPKPNHACLTIHDGTDKSAVTPVDEVLPVGWSGCIGGSGISECVFA